MIDCSNKIQLRTNPLEVITSDIWVDYIHPYLSLADLTNFSYVCNKAAGLAGYSVSQLKKDIKIIFKRAINSSYSVGSSSHSLTWFSSWESSEISDDVPEEMKTQMTLNSFNELVPHKLIVKHRLSQSHRLYSPSLLQSLRTLNLENNSLIFLTEHDLRFFREFLITSENLQELVLRGSLTDQDAIIQVYRGLSQNRSLKKVVLDGNELSVEAAKSLNAWLKTTQTLTFLDLSGMDICTRAYRQIGYGLAKNSSLTTLDLRDTDRIDALFVRRLMKNQTLTEIIFDHNPLLGRHRQSQFFTKLGLPAMRHISLSYCLVKDRDLEAISSWLKDHKKLEVLNLSQNQITDIGAIILAECLPVNRSLQTLDISENQISRSGIDHLIENLGHSIKNFYYQNNFPFEEEAESIFGKSKRKVKKGPVKWLSNKLPKRKST